MGAFFKNPLGAMIFTIVMLVLVAAYLDVIIRAGVVIIFMILALAVLKHVSGQKKK